MRDFTQLNLLTDCYSWALPENKVVYEALKKLHLLGHLWKPEEIASVIVFLLSNDASFVTGSEAIVDGGYTA